jgi:hypothetical protein
VYQVRCVRHLSEELSGGQSAVRAGREAGQVQLQDQLRPGLQAQGGLHPREEQEGLQVHQRSAQLPHLCQGKAFKIIRLLATNCPCCAEAGFSVSSEK